MLWSIRIGTIAGTAVRIHVTFLLFLVWIWGASYFAVGADAAWMTLVFILLLFACVLAHEFGHIFTARAFGVATPDVTLLPIGGVARLERIPEKPSEEFLIAVAGPLVNVAIALLLVLFAGADLNPRNLASVESANVSMADRLAAVNLFIAAFNLIPAFPMDGGRILRAVLSARLGFLRATEIAATIGQWAAFGLGFLGLFGNPLLIFIAIFVYLAASSEAQLVAVRAMTRGVPVGAAMMTQYASLRPHSRIDEAIEILLRTSQNEFPVTDDAGRLVGILGRSDMIKALKTQGPDAAVLDAMNSDAPVIEKGRCLEDAFKLLQEKAVSAVGVVDREQRLVGLITSETIGEMLMLRDAIPAGTSYRPWSRPAGA